jgi:transmembrane sensor
MDEIIIRALQGVATPAELEALRAWRHQSLANERHYRDVAEVWRLAEPAISAAPPDLTPYAARPARGDTGREGRRRALRTLAFGASAAAALFAGVALGVFWPRDAQPVLAAAEVVTGPHEGATTRLSDGTVVRLAPESRLRVADNSLQREVWLDGRGFFAVAREEHGRRFVVRTYAGEAVVLGTRFDVKVDERGMQVFVVEGRVAHNAGGREVQVEAMHISRAADGNAPDVSAVQDPDALLSWLGDFLVFQSTPLADVAGELENRFGVEVRVADPAVARRTVSAWFTNESLEDVVLIVCRAVDAHCSIRDGTVIIEP